MLESAEVGHRISKEEYAREEPKLREALLMAQWKLSRSGRGPVLLIISGVEAGGRGETANKLTEWMDPRHIRVVAFGPRSGDELERPLPWRYWRALPPKGRIGIFMNAWYNEVLASRLSGRISAERLELLLESIRHHERMLAEEGLVLLKFWIHLSKKDQKQRLERLEKDPRTRWRVTRRDWDAWRLYTKSHDTWELVLRESSSGEAPWYVVEGTDDHYRSLTVGTHPARRDATDDRRQGTARDARDHAARAVGHRQRPADPRDSTCRRSCLRRNTSAISRSTRGSSRSSRGASASASDRWSSFSKASTRQERAAPYVASPRRSTRVNT